MAKNAQVLFLEDWLQSSSGYDHSGKVGNVTQPLSSAQTIIKAWAELRESLQRGSFESKDLESVKSLIGAQASLYVADPQAKLVLAIVSSTNLALPLESYPFFLRLLYIWVRKSSNPSLELIESSVKVVSELLVNQDDSRMNVSLFSEGILLLGALSVVAASHIRMASIDSLSKLLVERPRLLGLSDECIPHILAGIGYGLSSATTSRLSTLLKILFGMWSKSEERYGICLGLMILHLVEWVVFGFIKANASDNLEIFVSEILENSNANYASFYILMAAAGSLRASSGSVMLNRRTGVISKLRNCAQAQLVSLALEIRSRGRKSSFLLQCMSLALSRSGRLDSSRGPLLDCLASGLLIEVFPLKRYYAEILEDSHSDRLKLEGSQIQKHLNSVLFKEAGAITGTFCSLYVSAEEDYKSMVEDLVWSFCKDVYEGHRKVAFLLRGQAIELLGDLEKVAESAFLMVVVFALGVVKKSLSTEYPRQAKMDVSVKILVSFSCMEYFRRIRLPQYVETISSVVSSVQEHSSACAAFVESLPCYSELTLPHDVVFSHGMKYIWYEDEVQTARILFYFRVLPTSLECLPSPIFAKRVAATIYLGHPNAKVSRASHSVFASFISSGKDPVEDERVPLKEQLVFYYIKRSLEGYPENTPLDGLATGVAALVRHLPAGSAPIYYCINTLVQKSRVLCRVMNEDNQSGKNSQGASEPCMKILELLLRLTSMVDIQVLPELMKLLAQLIVELPKQAQNVALNELHDLVAESDDVTRKTSLVSWLQSLSYICSKGNGGKPASGEKGKVTRSAESLDLLGTNARL
ncbi:hypothetical protein V2J09_020590 [Rumex salicifolius]